MRALSTQKIIIKRSWSTAHVWITFTIFGLFEMWFSLRFPETDVAIYRRYAHAALTFPLLHHWPNAYPGLSLIVFLLPQILPFSYRLGFAFLTLTCLALLLRYGIRAEGPGWGMRCMGLFMVGSLGVFSQRYDIVPAMLTFWALTAASGKRWGRAYLLSVFGVLLKMFPLVLWPLFLIQEWRDTRRWHWGRLIAAAAGTVAFSALLALLNPHHPLASYRYLWYRPVNISSVAGISSLWLGDKHLSFGYGSVNVLGPLPTLLSRASLLLGMIAGLWVLWALARGRLTLVQASGIAIGLLLVAMKIFSPQYLIWLIPIAAQQPTNRYLWVAFLLISMSWPFSIILFPPAELPVMTAGMVMLAVGLAVWARRNEEKDTTLCRDGTE